MFMQSTGDRRATGRRAAAARSGPRGRLIVSALAMLAAGGFFLVTVVDPYAGATAQSFYQQPVLVRSDGVQKYEIDGGYVLIDPKRDTFEAVQTYTAPKAGPSASSSGSSSGSGEGSGGGGATYTTPVGVAQTYAAKAVAKRGWAPSEFSCLVNLWNRESGWNTHAANPGSGAYGIPQSLPGSKMASAGADWQNSYATQIDWGLGYISGSYGSPCGAWGHSNAVGWY